MRYYYTDKDWYYFGFDYDVSLIKRLKSLSGFKYNPATKEWYIEVSSSKKGMIEEIIKDCGFVYKHLYPYPNPIPKPKLSVLSEETIRQNLVDLNLERPLREYQIKELIYLVQHGNCINGSDCGTGKTSVQIALIELLNLFPCIVVCPSSVKYSWKKEWHRLNPKRSIGVIDSSKKEKEWGNDVTIINYDIMAGETTKRSASLKYTELETTKFKSVIFDEIHFCKSKSAGRTKACLTLAKKIPCRYGLSGTLIQNRPEEIIKPLELIGRFKELFPDRESFYYRYTNMKLSFWGRITTGANYLKELNQIISNNCYVRVEKRDVLTELPDTTETTIDVDITNKKEYKKAQASLISYLQEIDPDKIERAERAEFLVRLSLLKQLSIEGKIKDIKKFIKEWCESNQEEKLLVFGVHREPLKQLSQEIDSYLIQGGLSAEKKQSTIDKFLEGDKQVLFANIDTIGTGTDGLQSKCANMVFIELPDKPSLLDQAIARIERQGQTNKMNVYYLLADTIDKTIINMVNAKRDITNSVNIGDNVNEEILRKGLCSNLD